MFDFHGPVNNIGPEKSPSQVSGGALTTFHGAKKNKKRYISAANLLMWEEHSASVWPVKGDSVPGALSPEKELVPGLLI